MRKHLLLSCWMLCLFACGPEQTAWKPLDLLPHSIPVQIAAPDSASVKASEISGVVRDLTVVSEADNYAIQIFSGRAFTNDLARLKSSQLELVRDNPYFQRIVEEEPGGFIFENLIDSTTTYGFRYILYKGDQEIIFQNGMGIIFTEEEVRAMYEAVQQ